MSEAASASYPLDHDDLQDAIDSGEGIPAQLEAVDFVPRLVKERSTLRGGW